MPSLTETRARLDYKRDLMARVMEEAGPDIDFSRVTLLDGDQDHKHALFRQLDAEINALAAEEDQLAHVETIARANDRELRRSQEPDRRLAFPSGDGEKANGAVRLSRDLRALNFKQLLRDNAGFQAFKQGNAGAFALELPGIDLKTLVTLTTISPQNLRQPDIVPLALEERTVGDLMLQGTVDRPAVEYYEETTFTNAATGVAEGSAKPEAAVGYTLRTENVRKIAHNIPATKESLDDNSFLESQLRGRLAFGVQRTEELQLLNGQGGALNLQGILNRTGIQTYAKATGDTNADAIYQAGQRVRGSAGSGFSEPTAVVIHPANWTTIRLMKSTYGDYIWGPPSVPGPDTIFGWPVRQTTAMPINTALIGAFRPYAEILRREGVVVTMSTEHLDFFITNKVMLQAEERVALAVYRPSAFCTVTALL